jgi:hypothetical protein
LTRFERDWNDRILPVLTERDPFRFVIRIQVLIEEILKEGIDTALPAGTPGELKGLRLRAVPQQTTCPGGTARLL